jgi:hypothetical protein
MKAGILIPGRYESPTSLSRARRSARIGPETLNAIRYWHFHARPFPLLHPFLVPCRGTTTFSGAGRRPRSGRVYRSWILPACDSGLLRSAGGRYESPDARGGTTRSSLHSGFSAFIRRSRLIAEQCALAHPRSAAARTPTPRLRGHGARPRRGCRVPSAHTQPRSAPWRPAAPALDTHDHRAA